MSDDSDIEEENTKISLIAKIRKVIEESNEVTKVLAIGIVSDIGKLTEGEYNYSKLNFYNDRDYLTYKYKFTVEGDYNGRRVAKAMKGMAGSGFVVDECSCNDYTRYEHEMQHEFRVYIKVF